MKTLKLSDWLKILRKYFYKSYQLEFSSKTKIPLDILKNLEWGYQFPIYKGSDLHTKLISLANVISCPKLKESYLECVEKSTLD